MGNVTATPSSSLAAQALVRQALVEQRALDESVAELLGAIGDLQTRVRHRLAEASRLLSESVREPPAAEEAVGALEPARVRVFCLGPFDLVVDGAPVQGWRSGKVRSLFQYLANHRDRPVPRDVLIDALWPEQDSSAPAVSLKVTVHALRQMLGRLGPEQVAPTIRAHDNGYRLVSGSLWLDVDEFERSLALGGRLESLGREEEALGLYRRAAELYRGDFLEDCWDDWAVFRREALKDQYLFVLARLADAALATGAYQRCIGLCQRLLDKDRCREDSYRTLMFCHARLGQRGRVRAWYELCVRTLRAELDVDPDPETERIYRLSISGGL